MNKFLQCLLPLLLLMMMTPRLGSAQEIGVTAGVQPGDIQQQEVSLDTLNIHLSIPIVDKKGVGLPFHSSINFNNNFWSQFRAGDLHWTPVQFGVQYMGWSFPYYTVFGSFSATNVGGATFYYGWIDPEGNMHPLPPSVWTSEGYVEICNTPIGCASSLSVLLTDGSGITLNLYSNDSYTKSNAVMPDGTIFYSPGAGQYNAWPSPFGSTAGIVTDVHGNTISSAYNSTTDTYTYTDTLGIPELSYTPGGLLGENGGPEFCRSGYPTTTYTYPTSTGNAQVVLNCKQYTVQTNFGCAGVIDAPAYSAFLVDTITLGDASTYSFTYESQSAGTVTGRLASVTYPAGNTTTYTYTGANNGVECGNELGNWIGGQTAGLNKTTAEGTWAFTRNTTNNTTTVISPAPANNKTIYGFSQAPEAYLHAPQPYQPVASWEYQGSSALLRTVSYCYNGNQTNCNSAAYPSLPITQIDVYTLLAGMSSSSRVSKTVDSYGNTLTTSLYDFGASTPTRTITSYNFGQSDVGGTCVAIGNGINNVPCYTQMYDGSGHLLRASDFVYDAKGNLLTRHDYTNTNTYTYLTTSHTYNNNGTVATSIDPNGNKSTFAYGQCNSGLLTKTTLPNDLNVQTIWDSGCAGAVPMTVTGPDGNSVSAAYNEPFWRSTSATDQLGNTANFTYTPTTTESIFNFSNSTIDHYTQINVNALTVYNQSLEAPASSTWDTVQSGYVWGSTGETTSTSIPCPTTKGRGCTTGVTTITHDALGRPLVLTDGGGGTLTRVYSGNIVTSTLGPAPFGEVVKTVAQEYNGLGQLVASCAITSATGSAACGFGGYTGFPTTTVYNADGTVSSVSKSSNTNTQTHSFTYDALGRVLTETYPESGTTTYVYDGTSCWSTPTQGLLTYKTDATGTTIMYSYDSLNRMIVKGSYGPNSDGLFSIYAYDSATINGTQMQNTAGRLAEQVTGYGPSCTTVATCLGSMTRVTDEGFSYTARGELTTLYEQTPNSGGYIQTNAQYFPNGAVQAVSGAYWNIVYGLDGKGRPYGSLFDSGSGDTLTTKVSYNAADKPLVVTLNNGDTDAYAYDSNTGRMSSYTFTVNGVTDVGVLYWNNNGTLRSLTITDALTPANSQTCDYGTASLAGYDAVGRLASVSCTNSGGTNVWGQNFTYDAFDNLTKTVPTGATGIGWQPGYNQANNRYTLGGTTYDANGNLLTDTFHTYKWNQDNHVVSVVDQGTTVTYDALGRRAEWLSGSAYLQTLLTPVGNFGVSSGTNAFGLRLPLPGGLTETCDSQTCNVFWHNDWLGSSRLISNIQSWVIGDQARAPYGEPYLTGTYGTQGSSFTGDYSDLVAGTFDTPNRELNPTQGRWISPDPAHSGWNAYAYTTNPLGETDPTGLLDTGGGFYDPYSWDPNIWWGRVASAEGWQRYVISESVDPDNNPTSDIGNNTADAPRRGLKVRSNAPKTNVLSDMDEAQVTALEEKVVDLIKGPAPEPPPPPSLPGPQLSPNYKNGVPLAPADSPAARMLRCTQNCFPVQIRVTSTNEPVIDASTGVNVHAAPDPHGQNQAIDATVRKTQVINYLQCSANCGAKSALNEYSKLSRHATAGHVHTQTRPGPGGSRGVLPQPWPSTGDN